MVTCKNKKSSITASHNDGKVKKHPPRTLRQIYSLCKSYPITDTYSNKEISEMILDDRSEYRYPQGCFGYKLIEATVKRKFYDNSKKQIYLEAPIKSKRYSFVLQFKEDVLYRTIRNEVYNNQNKIIVVAGKWKKSGIYDCFQTEMQGRKQIAVIKNSE